MTAKLLYLVLLEISDENGEVIIPQRKFSDTLHISKDTVGRDLRRLRYCGDFVIYPQYHSDDGGRTANKYRII